jgi:CheY-like chemotaxis protein
VRPLAARGYSRDGTKGKLQIEYGLLTDPEGRPVAPLTAAILAREVGADDFVVKPFDPCELMTRVKELARARR